MATCTLLETKADDTDGPSFTSDAFTPTLNDLLVVFTCGTSTAAVPTCSDSQGLGFTKVGNTLLRGASAHTGACFIANSLAAATSMTVTIAYSADDATGNLMGVFGVSGMALTGSSALNGHGNANNQTAATTPGVTLSVNPGTGLPQVGALFSSGAPPTVTPISGWTEDAEISGAAPTAGAEFLHLNSSASGTTLTWGSTCGSTYCCMAISLDTSGGGGGGSAVLDPMGMSGFFGG